MNYLTQNSKLKKDNIYSFNLPPIKTCPMAGECKKYCYACKGFYHMPTVKKSHARSLELTKTFGFQATLFNEIRRRNIKRVRIHATGDFYSLEYFSKWVFLAEKLPDVEFHAYTKSVSFTRPIILPPNFRLIFSYGGKEDYIINPKLDRHCKVFDSLKELKKCGYINCSNSDLKAATTKSLKLGIVKH